MRPGHCFQAVKRLLDKLRELLPVGVADSAVERDPADRDPLSWPNGTSDQIVLASKSRLALHRTIKGCNARTALVSHSVREAELSRPSQGVAASRLLQVDV